MYTHNSYINRDYIYMYWSIKMTKFTTLAIFIVLFLGMVAKETQGQHICRQILLNDNCDGPTCTALCDQKLGGTGQCYRTVDKRFICLCNYICKS
ncbi:unnamed protein product [Brassica oleracea var. botrytis]